MTYARIQFGSLREPVPIPREAAPAWRETAGPAPYEFQIQYPAEAADALIKAYKEAGRGGNRATMTLADDDGSVQSYTCFLLGYGQTSDKNYQSFRFADLRWAWTRPMVSKLYNWRRRVGDRAILQADAFNNQIIENEVKYHPASLNNGSRWLALEIIRDVLESIRDATEEPFNIRIEAQGFSDPGIENLEVEGNGIVALSRVLSACPSLQVRLENGKDIVVYSQLEGSESDVLLRQDNPVRDAGYARLQDNRFVRPAAVNVMFTRECELRFDFLSGDRNTSPTIDDTTLGMRNVLPLPDNDIEGLAQGTFVEINDDLFSLWGNLSVAEYGPLTDGLIREWWTRPGWFDGVAQIAEATAALSRNSTNEQFRSAAIWGRRFNEVRNHYRQTFAINPSWRDRILDLRDTRVAILNTTTGRRAPARCYQNYAVSVTDRAKLAASGPAQKALIGIINMEGYAAELTQADPSPFIVSVVDSDQGIVRVNLTTDVTAYLESVYPSFVEGAPNFDAAQKAVPRLLDEYTEGGGNPFTSLAAEHKASVILSAVPISPNSIQRYHIVRIPAGDSRLQEFGVSGDATADAYGPEIYVKASPALVTARFAWLDEPGMQRAAEIMFGFRNVQPADAAAQTEQYLTNPDDVREVALAEAANQFSAFANRIEGAITTNFDPSLHAKGTIGEVRHSWPAGGGAFTTVTYKGVAPTRRVSGLVSQETQNVINRMVKEK